MTLFEFLQCRYDGASTRSRTNARERESLRIDDQGAGDSFPEFCLITITSVRSSRTSLALELQNVPWNAFVEQKAEVLIGRWEDTSTGRNLTVNVRISDTTKLRRLAHAIRNVTGRGRRYGERNWKWMSRRTADSLERLANYLMDFRKHERRKSTSKVTGGGMDRDKSVPNSGTGKAGKVIASFLGGIVSDECDIFQILENLT